jgi:hypothetical protein
VPDDDIKVWEGRGGECVAKFGMEKTYKKYNFEIKHFPI